MGRNTGKNARVAKKKKVKVTKAYQERLGTSGAAKKTLVARRGRGEAADPAAAAKDRSQLLKRHAKDEIVLKKHLRDLADRKAKIIRGQNARMERRELGKYMRQLKAEQEAKHAKERGDADALVARASGRGPRFARRTRPNRAFTAPATGANAGDGDDVGVASPTGEGGKDMSSDQLRQMFANLL
jgi:hypothetical protein